MKKGRTPDLECSPLLFAYLLECKSYLLYGADNFTRLKALCANAQSFWSAVDIGSDSLQIRQPSPLGPRGAQSPGTGMDVSDILTELRAFAANCASIGHI